MTETVSLEVTRADGVRFVYNRFSPNGTEINFLTAHDDFWASVPVGRFLTASDALQAIEAFVMPEQAESVPDQDDDNADREVRRLFFG